MKGLKGSQMKGYEQHQPVFRDFKSGPPEWRREPDKDIDCPVCLFETGEGKAHAYHCVWHPLKRELIGTQVWWCPQHQKEVHPFQQVGEPLLADALFDVFRLSGSPEVSVLDFDKLTTLSEGRKQ